MSGLTCDQIGQWTCFEVRSDQEALAEVAGTFDPAVNLVLPDADQFSSIDDWPGTPFQDSAG